MLQIVYLALKRPLKRTCRKIEKEKRQTGRNKVRKRKKEMGKRKIDRQTR
jgi:hypothetical protein